MQLPRGTFRSIRKGVKLGEILHELASSRFTGISSFSSPTVNGTLVFKSGICILAKVKDYYGNPAWETVTEQPDLVADTALSDLDNAQLQLALDFNKKARVSSQPPARVRQVSPPATPVTKPPAGPGKPAVQTRRERKERDFIKTTHETPASPVRIQQEESPATKARLSGPEQGEVPGEKDRSPKERDDDFDTLDLDLDLDDVAEKIQKDCKIILKQLQLDHLTEK